MKSSFKKISKTKITYKILNTAKNEIPYQHLNDNKIRSIGWENEFLFKDAIKNTFDWYKGNM